ncbi:MAG: penicillin acylase family protein [Gemmatimonadaceae bacterium]|nr:penicillin acylase family protein [Gemmatimonadaceae bacterium]
MRNSVLLLLLLTTACSGPPAPRGGNAGSDSTTADADVGRWEQQAARVEIVRDDWGVPHVFGKSDADAVFGMIYAQAEDDFNRVEMNYLNAMGRLAEAEGEAAIWRDLRMKLFIDPVEIQTQFKASPAWLQALCTAWADGLNYYLHMHPETKPKVLTRFEPWMALTFSEGSIGGDIEDVSLRQLEAFYGKPAGTSGTISAAPDAAADALSAERFAPANEPTGSNGFAIAPKNTANKHALLLINPHTSFFFREEAQMVSEEGLNAYGAATWGQFFIYQGFNDKAGWMHTSSGADVIDEYAETVSKKGDGWVYLSGGVEQPVQSRRVTVAYKGVSGPATREFTIFRTQHGPVVREADGKWISVALMEEPVKALTQSWTRTKARNLQEFRATMELHTNSSNNTVYADADGNIAYFHANHVPKRNPKFDWEKPVDGSDTATTYRGIHSLDESPNMINPATGWIQNTNNWPYTVSGASSPKAKDFPKYMETYVENPRGTHAIRVLSGKTDFTLETLRDAAYDSYLPAFADLIPILVKAYDNISMSDPLRGRLGEHISQLRTWDYRWAENSVPTTLAVFWGEEMWRQSRADAESEALSVYDYMAKKTTPAQKLSALAAASDTLTANFGSWKIFWGDVNRFQRRTGEIVQPFSDVAPSLPVPFTSSRWGSLASFGARPYPGTKKWYGTSGNSFVAVVEFGDSVRAKAVTAGGVNGNPGSKHFNDQAERYAAGALRDVYFYRAQLTGHTERTYHPGK